GTAEAERVRAVRRRARRLHEGTRDVGCVVELRPAAERDAVLLAADGCIDRERRAGGHALVAAGAVDAERPQPDAGDAVVLPVDPPGALVRQLVDAVERARVELAVLVVYGRGARVGDRRSELVLLRRLEDVHGP